jgi:hypothetical protein
MKRIRLFALLALSSVAYAQGPPPPGPPPGGPRGLERGAMIPREFGIGRPPWKVVTGAPYSAEVSNSVVETLADGNTIHRTSTGRTARDSQGRTYLQETITEGPLAQN